METQTIQELIEETEEKITKDVKRQVRLSLMEFANKYGDIINESQNINNASQGCGKRIMVKENGSNHTSFCGCTYKGLHLCDSCSVQEASS